MASSSSADVAFALAAQWQSAVRFDAGPDAA
jgi:hypothetical protein